MVYLGSRETDMVAFALSYEPHWATKFRPTLCTSVRRNLAGEIVVCAVIGPDRPTGPHTFKFFWATHDEVMDLRELAHNGEPFNVSTAEAGTIRVFFASADNAITAEPVIPSEFFSHDQVLDGDLDLYNGEINVVIL